MRRSDRLLDPFAESTVDGIIAGTVSVKVMATAHGGGRVTAAGFRGEVWGADWSVCVGGGVQD